jgi:hypothetical protein
MDGFYELSVSEKSRIEDGFCAEYGLVQKHEAAGNHLLVEARTGPAMSLQMIDRRIFYDHSGKEVRKRCTE